ncbi:hypothetical protein PAMC26577_09795 [Caballeronia sordidicola]|uniref:Uncharacterized protein n=1 Tax=Caballeronia sordidicola TaxID=196367 RepID=A0A242N0P6_CABSO|nr:hypothetical protein PAMC26577_09795 [Caballeronia sordidicola]
MEVSGLCVWKRKLFASAQVLDWEQINLFYRCLKISEMKSLFAEVN